MKDTCAICGEYVPEGRQVCITCEKTSIKDSGNRRKFESGATVTIDERMVIDVAGRGPKYNASGCADPTAYEALKPIMKEDAELEAKVSFLVKVLKFIINESGFELLNRIELRHKQSRKKFR